jgi:beta-barrel assembly-enhancing protease
MSIPSAIAKHIAPVLLLTVAMTATLLTPKAPISAQGDQEAQQEAQMGKELFDELKAKGEIVSSSPLYDTLRPIADPITKVIQPAYHHPIHFYIVHEKQPNAFAAPGGNIYVVDSLFYFVKNREELAGTICHETSHLLHHDSVELMKQDQAIQRRAVAAAVLLPNPKTVVAAAVIARLDSLHHSRTAEERADITGSDTCAAARSNPWGLVWLFHDFSNADLKTPPEILSDHPNDQHRIDALQEHFRDNPATFGSFSDDPRTATALRAPPNAPEQFLR